MFVINSTQRSLNYSSCRSLASCLARSELWSYPECSSSSRKSNYKAFQTSSLLPTIHFTGYSSSGQDQQIRTLLSSSSFSALPPDEEENEKARVASLTPYQKEMELRRLDSEIARLQTLRKSCDCRILFYHKLLLCGKLPIILILCVEFNFIYCRGDQHRRVVHSSRKDEIFGQGLRNWLHGLVLDCLVHNRGVDLRSNGSRWGGSSHCCGKSGGFLGLGCWGIVWKIRSYFGEVGFDDCCKRMSGTTEIADCGFNDETGGESIF